MSKSKCRIPKEERNQVREVVRSFTTNYSNMWSEYGRIKFEHIRFNCLNQNVEKNKEKLLIKLKNLYNVKNAYFYDSKVAGGYYSLPCLKIEFNY